ncbi:integrin alpha-X-like [Arapaima gigas]
MFFILRITLCVFLVSKATEAFNLNPLPWKTYTNPDTSFGYRVIQVDSTRLLVSAPLINYSQNRTGKIYKCEAGKSQCTEIQVPVPDHGVHMSLGLSMAIELSDKKQSSKAVVCGPTVPRECETITTYNGMCFQLSEALTSSSSGQPPNLKGCPASGTDIVFLIDGSGSVASTDFDKMKTFMINLIKQFQGRNSQFAIMQYSSNFKTHMDFNNFKEKKTSWEHLIESIQQERGITKTPSAIRKVVNELFVPSRGARPNANKVLVVITDGKTFGDNTPMIDVVQEAENKGIIRFAIGVGSAFDYPNARSELETIASKPTPSHMFRVDNFQALDKLRDTLQKNIFAIEGTAVLSYYTQLTSLQLVSNSALSYDQNQFIYSSSTSQSSTPGTEISTRVEVYAKQSFTKEIVGGVLGAVLLLALIAAVLYKAGFFKSKYNQMVQEAGEDADGDAGDNADAPPATE